MAKEKLVTRSVIGTKATLMVVDIPTGTTTQLEVKIGGKFTEKEKVLKAVQKIHDNENQKVVAVLSFENFNTLYGMPESQFMEMASPLPDLEAKRAIYAENKAKKADK